MLIAVYPARIGILSQLPNFAAKENNEETHCNDIGKHLVGLAAYGQGMINFANFVPAPANINAPFLFFDGTKIPSAGWQASLPTTAGSLSVVDTVRLVVPG
jgi:hypothetical protein